MSAKFNLYGTEGCHLCEEALLLCSALMPDEHIKQVDIIEDEKLVELYRIQIPVLERLIDNQKLFWPFDKTQVLELL